MALINKSESEKLYNYLIREIRTCNTLTSSEKDIFINYLVDIKKGIQKNEFIDDEILAMNMEQDGYLSLDVQDGSLVFQMEKKDVLSQTGGYENYR